MDKMLLVFLGGGLGSLVRYGATWLSVRVGGVSFPWGTLLVNWMGCFCVGFVFALAERSHAITVPQRMFIMTGFLGGLTTFSTLGLESVNLARAGEVVSMIASVTLNVVGGLALVCLGMLAARLIR